MYYILKNNSMDKQSIIYENKSYLKTKRILEYLEKNKSNLFFADTELTIIEKLDINNKKFKEKLKEIESINL